MFYACCLNNSHGTCSLVLSQPISRIHQQFLNCKIGFFSVWMSLRFRHFKGEKSNLNATFDVIYSRFDFIWYDGCKKETVVKKEKVVYILNIRCFVQNVML